VPATTRWGGHPGAAFAVNLKRCARLDAYFPLCHFEFWPIRGPGVCRGEFKLCVLIRTYPDGVKSDSRPLLVVCSGRPSMSAIYSSLFSWSWLDIQLHSLVLYIQCPPLVSFLFHSYLISTHLFNLPSSRVVPIIVRSSPMPQVSSARARRSQSYLTLSTLHGVAKGCGLHLVAGRTVGGQAAG
jgi:hypothetical protein